ncbi:MAG: aminotransferase class I/II-fold pyridoxal phosphate-dependent enzyme [Deltaproteobacteria bacterium]|nr:aminotransferase class I/II-fold pyridoxal phosphate-dependent enzyme [Deltaproteobacteria bacterium]
MSGDDNLFTRCARAGHEREGVEKTRPTSMPIVQSSAFELDDLETLEAIYAGDLKAHTYTRVSNPTNAALERELCLMEGAERGIAFASGMAAMTAVFAGILRAGDHVVCAEQIYGVTYASLTQLFGRFGVKASFVDCGEQRAVERALRPGTRLIVAETLSNPTLQVANVTMLSALAKERACKLIIDNTFATPLLCRPIALGADVVVHSATKYLGGHSDVVGGIALGDHETMKEIFTQAILLGATMDPFAAWLVLRGLKTLALRMDRQCSNAKTLAARLREHTAIEQVFYPDDAFSGRGGAVVTLVLAPHGDEREVARRFVSGLEHIPLVTSLGGTGTTVNHPALSSHRSLKKEDRERLGITHRMLRLSVGIEDVEDLWREIEDALEELAG